MSDHEFSLPRDDEHVAICGQNGSGKSQCGAWLLSKRDLREETWIVTDYKGEELFNSLANIREIDFNEIPDKPGLYILRTRPDLEDATERFLWKLWSTGHAGLFVDEGYMLPRGERGAFQAILTQGRSLRIPVMTLTQRPVKVSPFAFSEASHVIVFDLSRKKDRDTIDDNTRDGFSEWSPPGLTVDNAGDLPRFYARWWQKKKKTAYVLKPVPDAETIVADIDRQLEVKRRWL